MWKHLSCLHNFAFPSGMALVFATRLGVSIQEQLSQRHKMAEQSPHRVHTRVCAAGLQECAEFILVHPTHITLTCVQPQKYPGRKPAEDAVKPRS